MANIRVDIDGLRQNKKAIESRIADLKSLNSQLDALLADIEGSWTGEASTRYIETMRQHKQKAEEMVTVLNEFKSYIEQAASNFEAQDAEGASAIRGC